MGDPSSNAETVAKRPIAVWTLGGLFSANAVGLDSPLVVVPSVASHFEVTPGEAQLVIVLFLAGYAVGHIPIGLLGDRFGRRPIILSGIAVACLMSLLAVFAPTFEVLIAARFLQGVATCAAGLLSRAVIRDVSSGSLASKLTSSVMMVLAVLIILTPLLSGYLLYLLDWRYVLAVTTVFLLVLFWLTVSFIPETMHAEKQTSHPWLQFRDSLRVFFQSGQSVRAAFLGAIAFATFFIFAAAGASLIVDVYGLPAEYFGPLFAFVALIQLSASAYNSHLVLRHGSKFILRRAAIMCATGILLSAIGAISGFTPLVLLIVIASVFAVAHALILPNSIAMTLDPLPATAGFASAIHGMMQTGVAACAGFMVSIAYDATVVTILQIYCLFGACTLVTLIAGGKLFLGART